MNKILISFVVSSLICVICFGLMLSVSVVDGIWDNWSDWDHCSVSCGGGTQSRQRECIGPFHGGKTCAGDLSETQSCSENPCPG